MRSWRTIGSRALFEHPLLQAEVRRLVAPDGHERDALALVAPDWVNIVAVTAADEIVLVRQWRFALAAWTLEIPGGMVDPGEQPQEAAARELLEETGYRARNWSLLGAVHPNPAIFTNSCPTYLARDLDRVGDPVGDGEEELEVVLMPRREVPQAIRRGEISHALVVAAFHLLEVAGS
jgi:8-oxo-dGTP pyrophosphatase MutT (NUDIX family)